MNISRGSRSIALSIFCLAGLSLASCGTGRRLSEGELDGGVDAAEKDGRVGSPDVPRAGAGGSLGAGGAIGAGGMRATGGTVGGGGSASSTGGGAGSTSVGGGAGTSGGFAMLSVSSSSHYFGLVEVSTASTVFPFTYRNDGNASTGTLSLTNSNPLEVAVTNNGCTGTLGPGSSCTLSVSFKPSAAGSRSARLTVSASPGGAVDVILTAAGGYRLTVMIVGSGTVTSISPGIACGATCSGVFYSSTTLLASTANGSGSRFSGWIGGGCSGAARSCSVVLNGPTTVQAAFAPLTNNLAFVTAETFPATLGSAVAYDAKCNLAAGAAGINDANLGAYVAMVSDTHSLARTRLGAARGWIRMDGRPFADTLLGLFSNNQIFNPVEFNDHGDPLNIYTGTIITGTLSDGTLYPPGTCTDWTSTSGFSSDGFASGGPLEWVSTTGMACATPTSILCLGKSRAAALTLMPVAGRKIWLSKNTLVVGGSPSPDTLCQNERPTGVTTAAAFIAHTNSAAASVLNFPMNYVRIDGTLVGTGAELADGSAESGIWQTSDGSYGGGSNYVWTGGDKPTTFGTAATTCGNWTDVSIGSVPGRSFNLEGWWDAGFSTPCGGLQASVYCVQTAP